MKQNDPLSNTESLAKHLARAGRVRLFLDYDGTLADFAPTPEHVFPDPELIDLFTRLVQCPSLRVAVISGRRLAHVLKLVPVPGILLAGTYGIELQTPDGQQIDRLEFDAVRPLLDKLKPQWSELTTDREGFFLEDKGWALALHARFADGAMAERVLAAAGDLAEQATLLDGGDTFRLLGGHKFLEIGPTLAHKGQTVEYLLRDAPWAGALPLYLGDDDKDEEAFSVVHEYGGICILVAPEPRDTDADFRLESPQAARGFLEALVATINPGRRSEG